MRLLWISLVVVAVDQAAKVAVLKNMYLGQQIPLIGDWLKFTFTENPGMAFGISFGPRGMVAVFSVLATLLIIAYMYSVRNGYRPYLASLALILGGALGNIIDRVFYGVIFGDAPLFAGKVVDFIHVNVWSGFLPEAMPFFGGSYMSLFPIWNVADMAIVAGVVGVLVFQGRFHQEQIAAAEAATPQRDGFAPADERGAPVYSPAAAVPGRAEPGGSPAEGAALRYHPPASSGDSLTDEPHGRG